MVLDPRAALGLRLNVFLNLAYRNEVKLLERYIRPPEGLYLTQNDPSVVAVEDGWYSS